MMKQIPHLIRLRADRTVSQFVKHYIENPLLQRAFSIHPYSLVEILIQRRLSIRLSHYLEKNGGFFFARGYRRTC